MKSKDRTTTSQRLKSSIDPNHTHFLLVDNADGNNYGGEMDFRTRLEDALSKNYFEETPSGNTSTADVGANANDNIPLVVIVVEGGESTFRTVCESVQRCLPCVFIAVNIFY